MAGDLAEELRLVADRAVGEEHHLAEPCRIRGRRVVERSFECRQHLGAAFGVEPRHEILGDGQILGIGVDGFVEQRLHGVVEADHVELVAGTETIEGEEQALLRLDDRGAGHRARIVDDEDQLAREKLRRAVQRRRRDHGQQIVLTVDDLVEERGLRH